MSGILLLTFDDCDIVGWTDALPLFHDFRARVTFSISGEILPEVAAFMRTAQSVGHTVGLHTVHHANAPEFIEEKGAEAYFRNEVEPQLEVCAKAGVKCQEFAFPNNRYNDAALDLLSPHFKRFRAGNGVPKNEHLADFDRGFVPRAQVASTVVFGGRGVGEYYESRLDDIFDALQRAAGNDEAVTFFSHGIANNAKGVNMPLEILTPMLEEARRLNMEILGLDDLDNI